MYGWYLQSSSKAYTPQLTNLAEESIYFWHMGLVCTSLWHNWAFNAIVKYPLRFHGWRTRWRMSDGSQRQRMFWILMMGLLVATVLWAISEWLVLRSRMISESSSYLDKQSFALVQVPFAQQRPACFLQWHFQLHACEIENLCSMNLYLRLWRCSHDEGSMRSQTYSVRWIGRLQKRFWSLPFTL